MVLSFESEVEVDGPDEVIGIAMNNLGLLFVSLSTFNKLKLHYMCAHIPCIRRSVKKTGSVIFLPFFALAS